MLGLRYEGSVFQTQQFQDDTNEENAYPAMLREERARFAVISEKARRCQVAGVSLPADPEKDGGSPSDWIPTLARFGIPYTTRREKVAFWDAQRARTVPDEEVMELIEHLKERYPVDDRRIYATGFSMGGCKTWDLFQEYPETFAALAPMDATFEVGLNQYGEAAPAVNRTHPVPVFYAAGEQTPLPEMPCQAEQCMDRAQYVFDVNRIRKPYGLKFEVRDSWPEKFWGVPGDRVEKVNDPSRGAVLTLHYYDSTDGVCRTVFGGVDNQGHECREHTCGEAWRFMQQFVSGRA